MMRRTVGAMRAGLERGEASALSVQRGTGALEATRRTNVRPTASLPLEALYQSPVAAMLGTLVSGAAYVRCAALGIGVPVETRRLSVLETAVHKSGPVAFRTAYAKMVIPVPEGGLANVAQRELTALVATYLVAQAIPIQTDKALPLTRVVATLGLWERTRFRVGSATRGTGVQAETRAMRVVRTQARQHRVISSLTAFALRGSRDQPEARVQHAHQTHFAPVAT